MIFTIKRIMHELMILMLMNVSLFFKLYFRKKWNSIYKKMKIEIEIKKTN